VRLFSKIKKTYGVNFGLSTLFEARTVRALGGLIRESRAKSTPSGARPAENRAVHVAALPSADSFRTPVIVKIEEVNLKAAVGYQAKLYPRPADSISLDNANSALRR